MLKVDKKGDIRDRNLYDVDSSDELVRRIEANREGYNAARAKGYEALAEFLEWLWEQPEPELQETPQQIADPEIAITQLSTEELSPVQSISDQPEAMSEQPDEAPIQQVTIAPQEMPVPEDSRELCKKALRWVIRYLNLIPNIRNKEELNGTVAKMMENWTNIVNYIAGLDSNNEEDNMLLQEMEILLVRTTSILDITLQSKHYDMMDSLESTEPERWEHYLTIVQGGISMPREYTLEVRIGFLEEFISDLLTKRLLPALGIEVPNNDGSLEG